MPYLALARKWRPKDFDEIVSQEHVSTTLKNSISSKRVAQAYLFAGPRGTGKTTTARIFAKALNCPKASPANPCGRCDTCVEIAEGRNLDVIEIDGASNNSVDDIRGLRESVQFSPSSSPYKIYIIDEVHMLSTSAFNALLKTLEEPPPHVKFIFATTEPHKVPATILSRCQRFDFHRIPVADMVGKLKEIAREEKIKSDEDALYVVARCADGSMRDAISVLEQLAAFSDGKIKVDEAEKMLGTVGTPFLHQMVDVMLAKDMPAGLELLNKAFSEGKDAEQLAAALIIHFRNLMMIKAGAPGALELSKEYLAGLEKQAAGFTLHEILYVLSVLSATARNMKQSWAARVLLEMTVVRIASMESITSLQDILTRLQKLEKGFTSFEASFEPEQAEERPAEGPQAAGALQPDVAGLWNRLVEEVNAESAVVGALLMQSAPRGFENGVLTIKFPPGKLFQKNTLDKPRNKKLLESGMSKLTGRETKVLVVLDNDAPVPAEARPGKNASAGPEPPILKKALKIFEGEIVE